MFRLAFFMLWVGASCFAAEEERRTYTVRVDNKQAGTLSLTIQTDAAGTTTVTSQADATVKLAVITFRYSFRGSEVWKNGVLQQMATSTNDDGKKHSLSAQITRDGLHVKADGREFLVKGQPWPTTYWRLPPENQRGPAVGLLDADTGKVIEAKLTRVGVEKINVLGQAVDCAHWKLTGGVQVDLWFDGADRMVRQESVEDGHRTVIELSRLQRD